MCEQVLLAAPLQRKKYLLQVDVAVEKAEEVVEKTVEKVNSCTDRLCNWF